MEAVYHRGRGIATGGLVKAGGDVPMETAMPSMYPSSRPLRRVAPALAAVFTLAACGNVERGPAAPVVPVSPDLAVARVVGAEAPVPAGVDPEGVVVAALLLTTGGDVEAALTDGALTAHDLREAERALAAGELEALFDDAG